MTATTAPKQVDQTKQDAFLGKMIGDIGTTLRCAGGRWGPAGVLQDARAAGTDDLD